MGLLIPSFTENVLRARYLAHGPSQAKKTIRMHSLCISAPISSYLMGLLIPCIFFFFYTPWQLMHMHIGIFEINKDKFK
jgi:hypothetical protein